MDINSLTQEQKDAMLMRFMAREAAKEKQAEYKAQGLSWSKNGFVTVRMGKAGDKGLPSLYIHPSKINELAAKLGLIQEFAVDELAKGLVE